MVNNYTTISTAKLVESYEAGNPGPDLARAQTYDVVKPDI